MRRRRSPHRRAVLAGRAAGMRAAPTTTESLLWQRLRGSQLGIGFRRRLVVEVDGGYHAWAGFAARDARHDRVLARAGWRVVRVPAELVQRDLDAAVALVVAALGR